MNFNIFNVCKKSFRIVKILEQKKTRVQIVGLITSIEEFYCFTVSYILAIINYSERVYKRETQLASE